MKRLFTLQVLTYTGIPRAKHTPAFRCHRVLQHRNMGSNTEKSERMNLAVQKREQNICLKTALPSSRSESRESACILAGNMHILGFLLRGNGRRSAPLRADTRVRPCIFCPHGVVSEGMQRLSRHPVAAAANVVDRTTQFWILDFGFCVLRVLNPQICIGWG